MMRPGGRQKVIALIAVLFLVSAVLAHDLRPKHEQLLAAQQPVSYEEKKYEQGSVIDNTPFQALIPVMLGFREVLAALMWVQADDLFHRGEYGPILALIKRIAIIDPHNLDVYATGAWHMAYNFMDRRLVEDGVKFLEQGVRNNPHVYDLFFELGYMHYDKTKNYAQAAKYYNEGRHKGTTTGKKRAPMYVWSAYAHSLERQGKIDEAIEAWREGFNLAVTDPDSERDVFVVKSAKDTTFHNLYMTQRRLNEREAVWKEWKGDAAGAQEFWQRNVDLAHSYLKEEPGREDVRDKDLPAALANLERVRGGKLRTGGPRDLHFDYTWKVIGPKRVLVEGKIDLVGLARVGVLFHDRDYDRIAHRQDLGDQDRLSSKMANATLQEDYLVQVKDGKFRYTLKLDEDPADMGRAAETIFPLKSEEYVLTVIFDPRMQSNEIQDRFGWNGEGLFDSQYLKADLERQGRVAGENRPRKYLEKSVTIRRADLFPPPGTTPAAPTAPAAAPLPSPAAPR